MTANKSKAAENVVRQEAVNFIGRCPDFVFKEVTLTRKNLKQRLNLPVFNVRKIRIP